MRQKSSRNPPLHQYCRAIGEFALSNTTLASNRELSPRRDKKVWEYLYLK